LTGCRLGEIENLMLKEVDTAGGCFRLADTKEGASIRPVGRPALDVIRNTSIRGGSKYVLPAARTDGNFGGLPRAIKRIMKRAELVGVSAHTLRHSYASVAGDLGYSDSTIETLIGHAAATVTSKYIHRMDDVLVAAANKVSGTIYRAMTNERHSAAS
jgi:integrase